MKNIIINLSLLIVFSIIYYFFYLVRKYKDFDIFRYIYIIFIISFTSASLIQKQLVVAFQIIILSLGWFIYEILARNNVIKDTLDKKIICIAFTLPISLIALFFSSKYYTVYGYSLNEFKILLIASIIFTIYNAFIAIKFIKRFDFNNKTIFWVKLGLLFFLIIYIIYVIYLYTNINIIRFYP